jgi:hypothetical protein
LSHYGNAATAQLPLTLPYQGGNKVSPDSGRIKKEKPGQNYLSVTPSNLKIGTDLFNAKQPTNRLKIDA